MNDETQLLTDIELYRETFTDLTLDLSKYKPTADDWGKLRKILVGIRRIERKMGIKIKADVKAKLKELYRIASESHGKSPNVQKASSNKINEVLNELIEMLKGSWWSRLAFWR